MPTRDASAQEILLSSLTGLMARWSSVTLQGEVAREAGAAIDGGDVQPLYVLGMTGRTRPGDLAARLRMTRPTMSKLLRRLDTAGLIVRTADPHDGRAVLIELSEAGARIHSALVERGLAMVDDALRDWPPAERRQFADLTRRFVAAIGAGDPEDPHTRPRTKEES